MTDQSLLQQLASARQSRHDRAKGCINHRSDLLIAQPFQFSKHDDFAEFDAELRFAMPGVRVADPKACQCGEVLKGVLKPWECKVFGTACTPETPIGTCMVSPEGACAAYYNFGRMHRDAVKLVART